MPGIRTVSLFRCWLLWLIASLAPGTVAASPGPVVRFEAGALANPVPVGASIVFGGTFVVEGVPQAQIADWPARVRWRIVRSPDTRPLAQGEVRIDRPRLAFSTQIRAERPGRYRLELRPAADGDGYRYRLPEALVVEARPQRDGPPVVRFRPAAVPELERPDGSLHFGGVLEIEDPGLLERLDRERLQLRWKVVRVADGRTVGEGRVRLAGARTLMLVSVRPPGPGRYRLLLEAPEGAPWRLETPQPPPEAVVEEAGGEGA